MLLPALRCQHQSLSRFHTSFVAMANGDKKGKAWDIIIIIIIYIYIIPTYTLSDPQKVTDHPASYLHTFEDSKVDIAMSFKVGMDAGTQDTLGVEWRLQVCHDSLIGKLLQWGLQPHL